MTDTNTPDLPVAAREVLQEVLHLQAIGLTQADMTAVLTAAHIVGVQLQGIPKMHRELGIARLRNFAKRAGESVDERITAVIARAIAAGWEHHSFNAEAKASLGERSK